MRAESLTDRFDVSLVLAANKAAGCHVTKLLKGTRLALEILYNRQDASTFPRCTSLAQLGQNQSQPGEVQEDEASDSHSIWVQVLGHNTKMNAMKLI